MLNLFNQQTETNFFPTILASGQALAFDEAAFYAHKLAPFDTLAANIPKDPALPAGPRMAGADQRPLGCEVHVLGVNPAPARPAPTA